MSRLRFLLTLLTLLAFFGSAIAAPLSLARGELAALSVSSQSHQGHPPSSQHSTSQHSVFLNSSTEHDHCAGAEQSKALAASLSGSEQPCKLPMKDCVATCALLAAPILTAFYLHVAPFSGKDVWQASAHAPAPRGYWAVELRPPIARA